MAPCHLKKTFRGSKFRDKRVAGRSRREKYFPYDGFIDLPSMQINEFFEKAKWKKMSYCPDPAFIDTHKKNNLLTTLSTRGLDMTTMCQKYQELKLYHFEEERYPHLSTDLFHNRFSSFKYCHFYPLAIPV